LLLCIDEKSHATPFILSCVFYLREIETLRLFDGNAAYFSRETSSEFYRSNKWIN